jgi:hypothetical protein
VSIPDLEYLVKVAREKYDALSGPERAYRVINQVCWDAKLQLGLDAGLFYKPRGAHFAQRSLDVVIFRPNGETFDALKDAEGKAEATWGRTKPTGIGDVTKWRAPVNPVLLNLPPAEDGPVVVIPDPPVVAKPDTPDVPAPDNAQILSDVLSALAKLTDRLKALEQHTATHSAIDKRLDALEGAPYVVQGHISVFGFRVPINLPVTRVE